MINIGGNPLMILLAIVAALGGVGLYFVRNIRPELARDHDIFFSAIALVYGIIVLAFNFRMEITTQLAQVLVVGFGGWFAVESLVLRQALANQARRSPMPPIMDDEPPLSSPPNFRVEVDQVPRRESSARRMRGTASFSDESASELEGDVDGTPTRARRASRSGTGEQAVIDIDERNVRPAPKASPRENRRPRRDKDKTSNRRRTVGEIDFEDF